MWGILFGSLGYSTLALADHGHGMHGMGMSKMCWRDTLTDEQRAKLAKLKLEHMKVQAPVKAKIKTVKVELALLVTSDKPDIAAVNKKTDELTKLKNSKMKEKYRYITAKRKLLNDEQKVLFDMHVIKKAMKGKYKGRHKGGRHH